MQDVDYRAFVEFNPDWVWELDAQGVYRYSNASVTRLLGYLPEEIVGRSVRDLMLEDTQSRALFSPHSLSSGLSLSAYRARLQHKNGDEVWLESVFLPFKDAQGNLLGYRGCHRDISKRIDMEQQLYEAEKLVGMGIWELDLQTYAQTWSDGIYRIFGVTPQTQAPSFEHFQQHLTEADRIKMQTAMQLAIDNKQPYDIYHDIVRKDGCVRHVHARANIIFRGDKPLKMLGSVVDITEHVLLRQHAEDSMHILNSVIDNVNNLIFYKSRDYVYMGCNRAFEQFMGHSRDELVGRTDFDFFPPEVAQHFRALDEKIFESGQRVINPQWIKYPDGSDVFLHTITTPFYDRQGNVIGLVGNAVDLTTEKLLSDQLEKMALYDGLTGVSNRTLFMRDLANAIAQSARKKTKFALLFIDLDGFKPVNDNFGHHYGDYVLKQVAKRLQGSVRATDFIARLGGDEFGVLLTDITQRQDVFALAEKMIELINEPITLDGFELRVSASIGIAFYPEHGQDSDKLLKLADDAMYVAKKGGKNTYSY